MFIVNNATAIFSKKKEKIKKLTDLNIDTKSRLSNLKWPEYCQELTSISDPETMIKYIEHNNLPYATECLEYTFDKSIMKYRTYDISIDDIMDVIGTYRSAKLNEIIKKAKVD